MMRWSNFIFVVLHLLSSTAPSLAIQSRRAEHVTSKDQVEEWSSGIKNLCIEGHIAPELILFGPARASTGTFANHFEQSPSVVFGSMPGGGEYGQAKEMHFFRGWNGEHEGMIDYLSHFPECTSDTRIVAADLTPGQHVPASGALEKMGKFYGRLRDQVKFVMFVREPASCLQSYYHSNFVQREHMQPFESYVGDILKNPQSHSMSFLNNVLIADSLSMFFSPSSPFKASQLTIVPMQYNLWPKDGFRRVHRYFWKDLNLTTGKDKIEGYDRTNTNKHATLEEDLTPSTLTQLRRVLDERTGASLLARLIQNASRSGDGPRLYGFDGNATNLAAVKEWIENSW